MINDDKRSEVCQQCGSVVPVAEIVVDEDTGRHLCRLCALEQESCGCSDELDE